MATHRIVLTIRKPNGDHELRPFPFNDGLTGSREAAEERMGLYVDGLPDDCLTTWEIVPVRAVREMVTV